MPTSLRELTTIRVGGTPHEIIEPRTREDLIAAARRAWLAGDEFVILGGGSNLVFADSLERLTVLRVLTRGIEILDETPAATNSVTVRVQAGESWDELVALAVDRGWSGIEALSGIPGQVGAAPIQNIGAYGQEVSSTISAVEFLDFESGEIGWLKPETLAFGYRTSCFKQGRAGLIIAVEFRFAIGDGLSQPISFSQLAASLGIELGDRAAISDVRQAVLSLRAAKGMVLNPADQDTVSCGSFFQNPVVSHQFARTLPADAPRFETVEDDGLTVKLSAAWLIENAGIPKGFALAGSKAAISSKHTLAITNRGGASADEVVELARFIQERVSTRWGITLVPEPNLVGF